MKKILLICIIFTNVLITAQTTFGNQNIISQSDVINPTSTYTADIDGDGDLDLLFTSYFNDKMGWFENIDGNGTYGSQRIITTSAEGAKSISIADIDEDGDIDIFLSSSRNDKIAWYENTDGNGVFSEHIISTTADYVSSVCAADIDGDGDIDLLSASHFTHSITWYENNGNGIFTQQSSDYVGSPKSLAAIDIDADGDVDVFSISNDNKIVWLENDGNGNFSPKQDIIGAFDIDSAYAIDIDGDGDKDILTSSNYKISWYENIDGNWTFGTQQVIYYSDWILTIYPFDVDGDGDMDVISAKKNPSEISWFENINGDFSTQQNISNEEYNIVYSADIDNDGDMDILLTSWNDKIAYSKNTDGNGNFGDLQVVTITFVNDPTSVHSVDIDGDGDMDVLSSLFGDDKIAWYENIDGNGNFGDQQTITLFSDGATSVYSVDIDGDGDMDVISSSHYDNKIAWYENIDGNGNFGQQRIISTDANRPQSIYAEDIDNDGDMDVISATHVGVFWFENTNSLGDFETHLIITDEDSYNFRTVYSADIDNDGDIDIISNMDDQKIAWFENTDGLGNFGNPHFINSFNVNSVQTADIDGDGDLDILVGSSAANSVSWHENTGNGNFGAQQQITNEADNVKSIYAVDIDNDGDIDVLSASYYDNKIAWYENINGDGDFGVQQIISAPPILNSGSNCSVYATDIDGDGNIDVLSAFQSESKIVWYKNLGATKNEITGNIINDFNQDGCDENDTSIPNILVTTNNGSDSFSTFTLSNGIYQFFTEIGNFTTTAILPEPYTSYYTFSPNESISNFTDIGNTFNADFCLEPISTNNDLNINILPLSVLRPGNNVKYKIVYQNVGTTQLSGTIDFNFDNTKVSFISSSQIILSQTSNSISFDYINLNPFESHSIEIEFSVMTPPTVQIGDVLEFETSINPVIGDETVVDNTYTFNQAVVSSYDPNDITCIEGNQVLYQNTDKYLHYLIRFQNTGNSYANFIRVHNTLGNHLDWNTIQMIETSHNCKVEIVNGNEVDFKFDGIYLPDNTYDEPNSHGFIAYKIKPKADIALDDVILNKADIFFDYNSPIETNTASTTIVNVLAVNKNTLLDFSVYPTPTENILNIKSKTEISKIEIYSKLGQLLLKNETKSNIDISNLTNGLYFVKVEDINGNFGVKKIMKI